MKVKSVVFFIYCFYMCFEGTAQSNYKFTGIWQGILDFGVEVRVMLHVSEDGKGRLVTTTDSPDQSVYGLKCDTTFLNNGSITIIKKNPGFSYTGRLLNDSTLEGTFTQTTPIRFTLKKIETPSERMRPQTPRPPFPYKSEDVEYSNTDKTLTYGATITIPEGDGPFPAAVLITGSGPQNRDEEILGHKSFAVVADQLTKQGFIILRVDDRGTGKSTGIFTTSTSADFAKDVTTSLDYLLSRPEVNKKKTGLIGHSEGGMIAPMVASKRKDVDFLILLAGPGVKIIDLMAEQNAAIFRSVNISQRAIDTYIPLYKKMMASIAKAPDSSIALNEIKKYLEAWGFVTDTSVLKELNMPEREKYNLIAASLVQTAYTPWFKYFLSFDPAPYLKKIKKRKILALNGSKDIQVISKQNLSGIEVVLKKSKSKNYTIKEIEGLNHLFQTCIKCTLDEYGKLTETFSPAALEIMVAWLNKNVK